MMKKINVVLICVIIALITGALGFFLGFYSRNFFLNNRNKQNSIAGTYHSTNWNGGEGVLILNDDGTCKYPTGNDGTWYSREDKIYINLDYSDVINDFYNQFGEEYNPTVENTPVTKDDEYDAIIVDSGIILHNTFFQKMS